MIPHIQFGYGDPQVKYTARTAYTEPVDNHHDLTVFEDRLTKNGVPWATYLIDVREKGQTKVKYVLVARDWDNV